MPVWVKAHTSLAIARVTARSTTTERESLLHLLHIFCQINYIDVCVNDCLLFSLLCSVVPGLRAPDSDQPLPSSNAPPCLPWVWPSNVPTGVTRQDLPAALNAHRPAAWLQQNAEQIQTNQLSKLTTNILNICISHIYIPPGVWFLFLYSYIVTVQLFYLQDIGLENEEIWVTWKRAWMFFFFCLTR